MQYFLSIDALITAIIGLVFGSIVILKNYKSKLHQTLFFLTISTTLWTFGYWMWLSEKQNTDHALFWLRILTIGSTFIPIFYNHWVLSVINKEKKYKLLIIFSYVIGVIFVPFIFTDLMINGVEPQKYFTFWPNAGFLYTFYLLVVYFGLVIFAIVNLIGSYFKFEGQKREQIKYILIASILGFGGGATNFFLWYDINVLPIGTVLVKLYTVLFSYAIIVHRLMDIKLVLRKSFVFLFSIFFVGSLALIADSLLSMLFESSIYTDAVILVIALSSYNVTKSYMYKIANNYFFTSLYNVEEVIEKTSLLLSSTIDDKQIFEMLINVIKVNFKTRFVSILAYSENTNNFLIKANDGFDYKGKRAVKSENFIQNNYINKNQIIIIEDLKQKENLPRKAKKFLNKLERKGVKLIIPLNTENKNVGLIALGSKESSDIYNKEDLRTLNIISYNAATAIQNALSYKEISSFNKRLKTEIKKATKDLEKANKRLKKLDAAKTEFISIASHQLRTPLTSIKGFASLMKEGLFGKLSKKQIEVVDKIAIANQRLINLVEDLLNVSRIEQGRMQYEFEKVDVKNVIENAIKVMTIQANYKELYLKYIDKTKKKDNTFIKADLRKFSEVVGNLIDNAIKYTQKGGIKVIFKKSNKDTLLIKVKDTGIGIRKEDAERLFEKFTRGSNVSAMHSNGTGLGLFVVQKITEAHGGKVWVESRGLGKGSTFFVEIPVLKGKIRTSKQRNKNKKTKK